MIIFMGLSAQNYDTNLRLPRVDQLRIESNKIIKLLQNGIYWLKWRCGGGRTIHKIFINPFYIFIVFEM